MTTKPMAQVVHHADLELLDRKVTRDGGALRYLEGGQYGLVTSIFESEVVPGSGPLTHSHPYAELFIVHEGTGRFVVDNQAMNVHPGDIVIVPPNAWHAFTNPGPSMLRHTAIHQAPAFSQTSHPDHEREPDR